MSDYLVEFNNISKFFGSVIALKDVTMKVKKGEIMCLLGDNGAGKSTLIKTLSGVHKPDEGEIIVEGNNTEFDYSMRNFYSTANTEIPSDQESFSNYLYGDMKSTKDGTLLNPK